MTDTDKHNDPDVVERLREIAFFNGPKVLQNLLTEAADTIAELRAELAAERGEAEGAVSDLWRPGFDYDGVVTWNLTTDGHGDLELRGPRSWYLTTMETHDLTDEAEAALEAFGVMNCRPHARPLMRAVEAEARRLGLIGEVPRG